MSKSIDIREEGPSEKEVRRGHRPHSDVSEKGILVFGVGLAVLIGVVLGATVLLVNVLDRGRPDRVEAGVPFAGYTAEPSRPQIQSDPALELREVREREERRLSGYERIDTAAGTLAIPIERAIELMADSLRGAQGRRDSLLVLTESGYVYREPGVEAARSPPFLGRSPEPYSVNPELAKILGYVDVKEDTIVRPTTPY